MRGWGLLALFASMLSSAAAHAQSPPPKLAPPVLVEKPAVPYPEGATGDATILVNITVGEDGSVRSVDEVLGNEPFASAAKEAVRAWKFAPATRDGKPIAAKIRVEVIFRAPVVEPAQPMPPAPTATTSNAPNAAPSSQPEQPSPPPPPKAVEITITGEKPAPSVQTLARTEVRQLPGAFGDPFRAIEILPGVTPIVSGLPYFYVRGAPPGNVGYFLDGVRVPYLFHVAIGPSVVNPAMVDRVDLYSGGYPARYGRFAGAIVSAETTAPRDDFHGEGNIRAYDAGAIVETGFDGGRGTVLLGGRYSYTAALFSLLSSSVKLDYRDYQARVTYDLTPRDRLGLFILGSYDLLEQITDSVPTVIFGSEFYRADLRYDHKLPHDGAIRWAATLGFDQSYIGEQQNATDKIAGTRVELTQPVGSSVTVHAGADATFDGYGRTPDKYVDPDDPALNKYYGLFPARTDAALGAWVDAAWRMDPRFLITPGVRFDLFRSAGTSALGVDPRLAIEVDLGKHVRLLHALGMAHQPPSFIVPIPGLQVASLQGGLQTSMQASSGVEVEIPKIATATLTAFDDLFFDMSDTLSVSGATRDVADTEKRSQGSGAGFELYVRRRLTEHLGGFLSYTFSRSTRRVPCTTLYTSDELSTVTAKYGTPVGVCSIPSAFDRAHVLNFALAYDLGWGVRAGGRFTFYTGAPSIAGDATSDANERLNPPRDPAFYRIDLRLEKRWDLKKGKWVSAVAEMQNTTLHKEVIEGQEVGPIAIPSIGLEGGF